MADESLKMTVPNPAVLGAAALAPLAAVGTQPLRPGDVIQDGPDCPVMVVIPKGSFLMGSPEAEEGRADEEGPVHEVSIGYTLAVARYPVTRGEWRRYLAETGRTGSAEGWGWNSSTMKFENMGLSWDKPGYPQDDSHPAVCLTWQEATEYAAWLTHKTSHSYRLLSEAEHEYVNRAGSQSAYF